MNKQAWIDHALGRGFESFEIYQDVSSERTLTWYNHQMDTFVTSKVTGTALRGVYNGKLVNMATENDSDEMMESCIEAMKQQGEAVNSDDAGIIRKPLETEEVKTNRTTVRPSNEEIRKVLSALEEKILKYDPRVLQVTNLQYREAYGTRTITNSYGMNISDDSAMQALICGVAVGNEEEVKDDFNIEIVDDLKELDLDKIVSKVCDNALGKLNSTSLASGTYPVILQRKAMTSLFQAFSAIFSGDLIGKGISPLNDKIGTQIFSDLITVVDNPRNPDAVNLYNYDDEGCPTSEKVLVDKGVFKVMLHNSVSAARMNGESTGNGFKQGYNGVVSVAARNCCIVPGEKSLDELCADMKDGFVITDLAGLHAGINFVTTNFSVQCSGYWVKDGVRDHSVSLVTIAANYLEMMKDVTAVGSDLEWGYGSIACPSVAFRSCAIAGK